MDSYISIKEFQDKVLKQELYSGYVIGGGYAFYIPIIIPHSKGEEKVSFDSNYTIFWIQKINTSPEMKMKSLKENPKKWSDFIGSTKLQRFAAKEFAKQHNGKIENESMDNIKVLYKKKIGHMEYDVEQYFHEDGTLVAENGEIAQMEKLSFSYFEMWLESTSHSSMEALWKAVCSLGYSFINSPSVLFTGRTVAGHPVNCDDKVSALIDWGPGMLVWATKATNVVSRVSNGLKGYNQYVKLNPHLKGNTGLPKNTVWQKHAGHLYQTNKQSLIMEKHADDFLKELGYIIAPSNYSDIEE